MGLPFIVAPALFGLATFIGARLGGLPGRIFGTIAVLMVGLSVLGVIPYLLFVGLAYWWSRGRSVGELRRAMNLSPLLVAVFTSLLAAPLGIPGTLTRLDLIVFGATWIVPILILGYLTVGIGHAIIAHGVRTGHIEPA